MMLSYEGQVRAHRGNVEDDLCWEWIRIKCQSSASSGRMSALHRSACQPGQVLDVVGRWRGGVKICTGIQTIHVAPSYAPSIRHRPTPEPVRNPALSLSETFSQAL